MGFNRDVVDLLKTEASKLGMFTNEHKCYVGILFDEMKIKADLVYDKHSGELIGYCNLDKVGNQMLEMSAKDDESEIAEQVLDLMLRGITTDLKFPLACFSTKSLTADFCIQLFGRQ